MRTSRLPFTLRATSAAVAVSIVFVAQAATPGFMQSGENRANVLRADVVVFGATPAGVTAAVAAARAGRRVRLLEPGEWVGGMMSGGLSNIDTGPRGPGCRRSRVADSRPAGWT